MADTEKAVSTGRLGTFLAEIKKIFAKREIYGDDHVSLGRTTETSDGYYSGNLLRNYNVNMGYKSITIGDGNITSGTLVAAIGDGCSVEGGYYHDFGNKLEVEKVEYEHDETENAEIQKIYLKTECETLYPYFRSGEVENAIIMAVNRTEGLPTQYAFGVIGSIDTQNRIINMKPNLGVLYQHKAYAYHESECYILSNAAIGDNVHIEGLNNAAKGCCNHLEGRRNIVKDGTYNDDYNHLEGSDNICAGSFKHMVGIGLSAENTGTEAIFGEYNILDKGQVQNGYVRHRNYYAMTVGNGNSDAERSNAYTLDWEGNGWFAGDVTNGKGVSLDSLKKTVENMEIHEMTAEETLAILNAEQEVVA